MSYTEYNDLLLKCQKKGKYRVFTFDIINSSKMVSKESNLVHYCAFILIERVCQDIITLEEKLNRKILISYENNYPESWFCFGDVVGFSIYNDSIYPEIIYKIFDLNANEMNLQNCFHKYDLVYETNEYKEGKSKYLLGYAIEMCSNMHKQRNSMLKKKVDRIKTALNVNSEEINFYMSIVYNNHYDTLERAMMRINDYKIKPTEIENIKIGDENVWRSNRRLIR